MVSEKLERKRLKLAREEHDLEVKKVEAEIENEREHRDLEEKRFLRDTTRPWYSANLTWLGPMLGALVAIGTLVVNQYLERENKRFNRESQIILQATDGVSFDTAVENLAFYLEAGMIEDSDGRILELVEENRAPVTNSPGDSGVEPCGFEETGPPSDLAIKDHRLYMVEYCQSPNHGGKLDPGGVADYVIIDYTTSGSLEATVNFFQGASRRASSHIVIGRDGRLVQLVPLDTAAWHAGRSEWDGIDGLNGHSIGISLINWGRLTSSNEDGKWVSWSGVSIPDEQIEIVGSNAWHKFTDIQMSVLIDVLGEIGETYNISSSDVIGQADISPGRKIGPGLNFPWDTVRFGMDNN